MLRKVSLGQLVLSRYISFCLVIFVALLPREATAEIWQDSEEWSEAWEQKFSDWVSVNWHAEITQNKKDPLLFGIEFDCSDAVYAMRIIFAKNHSLPFIINDPRRKGRVISNRSDEWDNIRERLTVEHDNGSIEYFDGDKLTPEKKLRRFIDDISSWTTTYSLARDTYPIALKDIRPGDIYLRPGSHSFIVSEVADSGVITTLSASTPRAWRPFAKLVGFPSYVPLDKKRRDGYRRFKPVKYLKAKDKDIPLSDFSQWKVAKDVQGDWNAFSIATKYSLAKRFESVAEQAERLFDNICSYARERVIYVDEARNYLQTMAEKGRTCMSINEYVSYSTPARDARLKGMYRLLESKLKNPSWKETSFFLKRAIESIFAEQIGQADEDALDHLCLTEVDIFSAKSMNLREIWHSIGQKKLISDPHAPVDHRWGYADEKWRPKCKTYSG